MAARKGTKLTEATPEKIELVLNFFESHENDFEYVIDVGGTSRFLPSIRRIRCEEVILLNLNRLQIAGTENAIQGDAIHMPLKSESVDLVVTFDTLEHLSDPDGLLSEAHRVLKENGYLALGLPNFADLYSRLLFLAGFMPVWYTPSKRRVGVPFRGVDGSMGHRSMFTQRAMRELLDLAGFRVEMATGYTYLDILDLDLIARLESQGEVNDNLNRFRTLRRILGMVLPHSMREGLLFVCRRMPSSNDLGVRR